MAAAAAATPAAGPSPRAAGAEGPATVLLVRSEAAAAGAAPPNCSHGAADLRDLSRQSVTVMSSRVGLLLASKALVQLLCNPLVGLLTSRVGSRVPQLLGSASLLAAALGAVSSELAAVCARDCGACSVRRGTELRGAADGAQPAGRRLCLRRRLGREPGGGAVPISNIICVFN
ncbi:Synaptic vesicular amine transporter [Gryllus bimaculatus]|nr:Synaptic vesicular amine transporter [Gryllus bimaculatus]